MASLNQHFLIGAFADYYQELVLAKRAIAAGKLAGYLGVSNVERTPDDAQLLAVLYRRLKGKLTQQQRLIRANATAFEQRDYLKVLYAACALTDEQFIFDLDWEQQENWREHYLMERAFFGTDDSGFAVFDKIEEILADRSRANNRSDLVAVYLLIITLGFCGKYRDWQLDSAADAAEHMDDNFSVSQITNLGSQKNARLAKDTGPLERVKEKLYRALDKPLEEDYIFAQAYKYLLRVVEAPRVHRMSPMRRWYKYAVYAVFGYLIVSSIIWLALTKGLESEINSFQSPTACVSSDSSSAKPQSGKPCSV